MLHFVRFLLEAVGRGFRTALVSIKSVTQSLVHYGSSSMNILPDSLIEDALQVALSKSGTLEVLVRLDLPGTRESLLVRHGLHALLA
jgi:hypothetical protein